MAEHGRSSIRVYQFQNYIDHRDVYAKSLRRFDVHSARAIPRRVQRAPPGLQIINNNAGRWRWRKADELRAA